MPAVQTRINAVSPQLSGKLFDPFFMGLVVPAVGDEDFRMGRHSVRQRLGGKRPKGGTC
jgi:hypothetical protein